MWIIVEEKVCVCVAVKKKVCGGGGGGGHSRQTHSCRVHNYNNKQKEN